MSPLNQPLQAEIFIDTENEALDVAVTVGLASRQAHRDAGLVFSPELTSIEFRVDLASPSPRIALTTQRSGHLSIFAISRRFSISKSTPIPGLHRDAGSR